jgi:3-mercaptopropionate dioxygenase
VVGERRTGRVGRLDVRRSTRARGAGRTTVGLDGLVLAVPEVVERDEDWQATALYVAAALERHLPTSDVLTSDQRASDPEAYRSHVLHVEPDGSFSIVALVWLPGHVTPIHDHVTWCVIGVVQGLGHEELSTLDEERDRLTEAGNATNQVGDVSGFAPPGDIHRVRNVGSQTAISIHVYGTDVSRVGSSVRRYYRVPVRPERTAA